MSSSVATPTTRAHRISRLGRRLALKPYGDELLTRSGDFWIFSARLIILTMAVAEGLAWGYMGSLMSRSQPLFAAVIAGLFVFTLIWIIDATFMTLDLSRGFYERALTGKREESAQREKLKIAAGVVARVTIVTASLVITAPFLAQAIFAGDVRDEMTRRNANTIAAKRQDVEQSFVSRINELRNEQKQLEEQRVHEAAGVGPSGKYGRGPALETIERQLSEKRQELGGVEASRASALSRFDQLSPRQLEERYGLQFVSPGVSSSRELLDDLLKKQQFTGGETAVRAFLAFLFLGLLILKGFQPRSVAVYYNEQLHSIYDEYQKGLFDAYLPEPERARAGASIEPLRFEEWALNTYAVIRKEDEHRRRSAREYRIHELVVEQWQRLESTVRREIEPLIQEYDATLVTIEGLENELHAARASAATAAADLQNVETAYGSMLQHIDNNAMDGPTFEQAMAATRDLADRRRDLTATARKEAAAVESGEKRLQARRVAAATLADEIATRKAVIADAQQRIGQERMKIAEIIGSQRELWCRSIA